MVKITNSMLAPNPVLYIFSIMDTGLVSLAGYISNIMVTRETDIILYKSYFLSDIYSKFYVMLEEVIHCFEGE